MTAGGFAEMDTEATGQVLAALETTGTTLANDWQGAQAAIAAGEAGIGGDEIARSFRIHYDPARDTTHRTANRLPQAFESLVDSGRASALDYINADARAAGRFRGLPPIQGPR